MTQGDTMQPKTIAITSTITLSLLGLILAIHHLHQAPVAPSLSSPIQSSPPPAIKDLGRHHDNAIDIGERNTKMTRKEQLQSYFNQRFHNKLNNPYWQLKLIESMTQLFQQLYPDHWKEEMLKFIRSQYPQLADALINKINALHEYKEWMASLEHSMDFTGADDRLRALWDKRLSLFGEEAYIIWEAAYKDQQFEQSMATLKNSHAPFKQKVNEYKDIFTQVHGVDVSDGQQKHKTQIMTRFLSLKNIQSDLQAMPPEERKIQLRAFRESLGLDNAALNRWETLDAERDQQRAASEVYTTEKNKLQAELSGPALEQAIIQLQNKLFGEKEANFIRNEEASGFFRFEQEQQYGIN